MSFMLESLSTWRQVDSSFATMDCSTIRIFGSSHSNQFVVETGPSLASTKQSTRAELQAIDEAKDLWSANKARAQQVGKLEGQLRWIESRPIFRALSATRRALRFGSGKLAHR